LETGVNLKTADQVLRAMCEGVGQDPRAMKEPLGRIRLGRNEAYVRIRDIRSGYEKGGAEIRQGQKEKQK